MIEPADTIAALLFVNAGIGALYSFAVKSRADSWSWPLSWLRVVAGWLGSKALWLGVLGFLWGMDWIGYGPTSPEWTHWAYVIALLHFTAWHVLAVFYWLTGRSTKRDTPGSKNGNGLESPEQMRVHDLEDEVTAGRLERTERGASDAHRSADAAERTAEATERIADHAENGTDWPILRGDGK